MKEYSLPCEAPSHVAGCDGCGSTKDHFTPRCVAKLLRWSGKQVNSPENIQHLSPACHSEKDKDTPTRMRLLKEQLKEGKIFDFAEHQEKMKPSKKSKPNSLQMKK